LFSDQKRRGFHLQQSPLADPRRLSRLLRAACFASLWVVYLGTRGEQDGWGSMIHRGHRCDMRVFQRGVRLLEHFLNEGFSIPVAFYISI
jgi:hypothetical protein